ncbi:MAG: hypothetical protein Tsb009_07210 [Planctomycetaceae bacterium]
MTVLTFEELDQLSQAGDATSAVDKLITALEEQKDYHRLFDALLLKAKLDMGLPLIAPSSFENVPAEKQEEFERHYVEAARRIGLAFLEAGNIPQAWVYLRTIREPQPVREALDKIDARREASEETDELINVALYEAANPVKGMEILLRVNGVCNAVTALDQQIHQMEPDDQRAVAALMVRELYEDLSGTLRSEVEQKLAGVPAGDTLLELMNGRDWLFEEGNYHIDVSHLNAVVRFARFLKPGDPELPKAIELAEYGSRLAPQFQYPGDPPFDDFYPAHIQYFKVLADEDRDAGIAFFQKQIDDEPDEQDKPMIAFVLIDLLKRIGKTEQALELANQYLRGVEEGSSFSFSELCQQANRLDLLRECARDTGDLVTYAATLLQK